VTDRATRSAAEWITFAGSCAIIAAMLVLVGVQAAQHRSPAAPEVELGPTTEVGDQHFVEVTVRNAGDATTANVQVAAELDIDDTTTTADQTIDFLAGDEEETITFVFADPPSAGELTVDVASFAQP
jgi:uncharacterized protein (TIGR02588 family)